MSLNLKLYRPTILVKGGSVFTGFVDKDKWVPHHHSSLPKEKLMEAFLSDDDIQEMSIVSTNFGIARTYQKQYRKESDEV